MKPIYDSRDSACKQPFGAVATRQTASFAVHLPKTLPADRVFLRMLEMDKWDQFTDYPMDFFAADVLTNSYRCTFLSERAALYMYHFWVRAGDEEVTVKKGLGNYGILGDGELWQLTVYDENMRPPVCLREGVMYQIFPDRFYSSGEPKRGVPEDRVLRGDWGGVPEWRPNRYGEVTNSDYFCGDLAGIARKLDYLKELGVTVLYLNPIFEAQSNHRYNTADYRSVDPLLGTNEEFRLLCRRAKEKGIAVILDGVFSHTGSDSIYFNREGRYGKGGAYNDPGSPYVRWYRFHKYPGDYESWWDFLTLPNVEETEPSYLEFICGEDGVLRQWLRMGASGFRLDVADELPDLFLDRLRQAVKAENPDAAVIGEVWEDASNKVSYGVRRRYLLGGQLDSVMNYPFKDALLNYIRHGGGAHFYDTEMQILENYPPAVIPALMNSLSTHDTPRAITVLAGDYLDDHDRAWQEAHHNLSEEQYDHGKRLLLLASVLQFGLPGMPCIYYGDEAGLCGYKDPFNRTCYPWGSEDAELLEGMRALGRVRTEHPVFSTAEFLPITFDDSLCAFARSAGDLRLVFAVNRGGKERVLPLLAETDAEELYRCGDCGDGVLGPYSGVVLRLRG